MGGGGGWGVGGTRAGGLWVAKSTVGITHVLVGSIALIAGAPLIATRTLTTPCVLVADTMAVARQYGDTVVAVWAVVVCVAHAAIDLGVAIFTHTGAAISVGGLAVTSLVACPCRSRRRRV